MTRRVVAALALVSILAMTAPSAAQTSPSPEPRSDILRLVSQTPVVDVQSARRQSVIDGEVLKSIRSAIGGAAWDSLYRQQPSAAEGAVFKREWWRFFREQPTCKRIVQSWDTAFSEKNLANRSACITWGLFRYRNNGDPPRLVPGA